MSKPGNKIAAIRGMEDILPLESYRWQKVEDAARRVFARAGFAEIRTPLVEPIELFIRGVGESTAIVEKEMYTFADRNGSMLALRPEGTASVVRAYVAASLHASEPISRLWYAGPMFRYERPQKGRQRQFSQIGVELLGSGSPYADTEVITLCADFFSELGLADVTLEINSIGCSSCRPPYHQSLLSYLHRHGEKLCDDCRRRMEKNPLRVFDCKELLCQKILSDAPKISGAWCETCREHFGDVQKALNLIGRDYIVNERIVRGLDYYMRTAFEFVSDRLGAQNAVAAGGRYDGLVSDLGGPDIPGVGFAIGMERLILLLEEAKKSDEPISAIIYVAVLSPQARDALLPIIQELRRDGVRVEWDYEVKSLKGQMRRADKVYAQSVIIVGDDEMAKGCVVIRNMKTKEQHEVRLGDLVRTFVSIDS